MRICRSCSPSSRACLRTSTPHCYNPSCLPRRRCRSLSPKRPVRQFYEHHPSPYDVRESLSLCDVCKPITSGCSPRCITDISTILGPCQPRTCCFGDRPTRKCCVSRRCGTTLRCKYLPSTLSYPCISDSCFTRPCDTCPTGRDYCYPRKYDKCDSCYPWSCRPSYRSKWDSCIPCDPPISSYRPKWNSCTPCYPTRQNYKPKWESCIPCDLPKCDPCCPQKCDMCCTPRRRRTFESSIARTFCDPSKPCYSSVCGPCNNRIREPCRPRHCLPCDNSSALSRIKLRDMSCDNFRKVCYPKEVPLKSCAIGSCGCDICNCSCMNSSEPACEVANVDPSKCAEDDGPSENFYEKSRRLGPCIDRYDPHLCPWEADVSISGTVRGHCTSTTVEVARRMSGRFRAEGDRYTTDSRENKTSCLPGAQQMSLGKLDDGTALNFSRNNDLSDTKSLGKSKLNETYDFTENSCRRRRNQRAHDQHLQYKGCHSGSCKESSERTRSPGLSSCQHRSIEIMNNQKTCSRRSLGNCVTFGSENEKTNQNAKEVRGHTHPIQYGNTSCSEVQYFLDSRKEGRRRSKVSSPISKEKVQTSSPNQRIDPQRYLSVSPNSHSLIHHKAQNSSDEDSPLFTPPTHCSPLADGHSSAARSRDDLDNISLHSLSKEDSHSRNRRSEYREVSFTGSHTPSSRRRSLIKGNGGTRMSEDNMRSENY